MPESPLKRKLRLVNELAANIDRVEASIKVLWTTQKARTSLPEPIAWVDHLLALRKCLLGGWINDIRNREE